MVYTAKMRHEIDQPWQLYQKATRVWAQKPYDSQAKVDANERLRLKTWRLNVVEEIRMLRNRRRRFS